MFTVICKNQILVILTGERKDSSHILLWSLILQEKHRFEVKSNKSNFFPFESDEKSPKPVVIFEFECPPFWTAFLPVSSVKGMPAAIL